MIEYGHRNEIEMEYILMLMILLWFDIQIIEKEISWIVFSFDFN